MAKKSTSKGKAAETTSATELGGKGRVIGARGRGIRAPKAPRGKAAD